MEEGVAGRPTSKEHAPPRGRACRRTWLRLSWRPHRYCRLPGALADCAHRATASSVAPLRSLPITTENATHAYYHYLPLRTHTSNRKPSALPAPTPAFLLPAGRCGDHSLAATPLRLMVATRRWQRFFGGAGHRFPGMAGMWTLIACHWKEFCTCTPLIARPAPARNSHCHYSNNGAYIRGTLPAPALPPAATPCARLFPRLPRSALTCSSLPLRESAPHAQRLIACPRRKHASCPNALPHYLPAYHPRLLPTMRRPAACLGRAVGDGGGRTVPASAFVIVTASAIVFATVLTASLLLPTGGMVDESRRDGIATHTSRCADNNI